MKLQNLFVALLFGSTVYSAHADIVIHEYTYDPNDTSANLHPVLDKNSRPCAVLRLKTDDQAIRLEAYNTKGKRANNPESTLYYLELQNEEHPHELWAYLGEGTTMFRLIHPQSGLMADAEYVTDGFFVPTSPLIAGATYTADVELSPASSPFDINSITLPKPVELTEVTFVANQKSVVYRWDNQTMLTDVAYKIPVGEHTLVTQRGMGQSMTDEYILLPGQKINIKSSFVKVPTYLIGGVEVCNPSTYSNLAYGVRIGIVRKWGVYGSFVTTFGGSSDGLDVDISHFYNQPISPYTDGFCQYTCATLGTIYRFDSPFHLYGGLGYANRTVTWLGRDNKRHEDKDSQQSGIAFELGALYNWRNLYFWAGTQCFGGKFSTNLGVGMYIKTSKE